jgi:hypothetical protein
MSDKKDDHGHGDDKKSPVKKLLGFAGLLLAVLVFVYFLAAVLPEIVRGSGSLARETGTAGFQAGQGGRHFAAGMREFLRGMVNEPLKVLATYALGALILFLIIKEMIVPLFKKDDHHGGGHP